MRERIDVVVPRRDYRQAIEEERRRKLWEETHKEKPSSMHPFWKVAILAGLGIGIINSYATAMETWARRNETQ